MEKPIKKFICSRQVECLIEIEAFSLEAALAQLPSTADDLVEQADGVAFGTLWEVQVDGHRATPQLFDDSDVDEAKSSPLLSLGDG